MAPGRPVVATPVGGLLDAVEDGVTGILVPPRSPQSLRHALESLLGDAELRRRYGAAARDRADRELSWAVSTTATVAAYHDAIASA
jgi:glycosyltransferase involved in cell wall biosynthesis